MKNLLGVLGIMLIVMLSSCSSEECQDCSGVDPFFGLAITSNACENGDGTITVTASVLGITQDTTFTSTIEAFVTENEADGLTCMKR